MKRIKEILVLTLVVAISSLSLNSCSSNDDSSSRNEYPKTVNIKFEITTSRNSQAIISTTLNNNTETENVDNLPFSKTLAQTQVNVGTYLKLTYIENGLIIVTPDGTNWTDYSAELKIYVNNVVVKTQTFSMTESDNTVKEINYTFE